MAEDAKIQQLEDELKLVKNEIKHVLTDIEEFILDARNPFRTAAAAPDGPTIGVVVSSGPPSATADGGPHGNGGPVTASQQDRAHDEQPVEREAVRDGEGRPGEGSPEEPEPVASVREGHPDSPADATAGGRPPGEGQAMSNDVRAPRVESPPSEAVEEAPSRVDQLDLGTIVALGQWVRGATKKIGETRIKTILEICQAAGYLSDQANQVLLGLASLSDEGDPDCEGAASMRTSMVLLAQLRTILQQQEKPDSLFLSLMLGLEED